MIKDPKIDSSLDLLREGNCFIVNRCKKYATDAFTCRLMLKKTVCVSGGDAAQMFYEKGRMTRQGAIPRSVLRLLQDRGSVATLNDQQHRQRKAQFMSLMDADNLVQLEDRVVDHWHRAAAQWPGKDQVDVLEEAKLILGRAVFEWCGIIASEQEIDARIAEIGAMIDGAGAFGLRNWRATLLRMRTERWLRKFIDGERTNTHSANTPLYQMMRYRESGDALPTDVIAVEILNILRPTVAIAWFFRFAVLALHQYPECQKKIPSGSPYYLEWFVQEVRRFYPFFPFVGGVARESFTWREWRFSAGTRFLLDIYGTNHDARLWHNPEEFFPERFKNWLPNAYTFIPQGGGNYHIHHRCPGEEITIRLMKTMVLLLVGGVKYDVKSADYRLNMAKMPAAPHSPVMICNVLPIKS